MLPALRGRALLQHVLALALWMALGLGLSGAGVVRAQGTGTVSELRLAHSDEGLYLSAQLHFELPTLVEDALYKGIPMYFVLEAQVARERWYWADRQVAQAGRYLLQRVAHWKVAEPGTVTPGAPYNVRLAFRLDTSQLARPFQIGALGSNGWSLALEHRATVVVQETRP